jgi:N-formylglutamate deformylase
VASNFEIVPGDFNSRLIIHIPHSSRYIPAEIRNEILLGDLELESELDEMTDSLTQEMALHATAELGVKPTLFINKFSRLVIDPERFPDDREVMNKVGMGAVYLKTSTGIPLRSPGFDGRQLIARYFAPYAQALTDLVQTKLQELGGITILDFHSYRENQHPNAVNHGQDRPPVCIGTDEFHTPPALANLASEYFSQFGPTVFNQPYAGTYVPLDYYQSDPRVHSIMLENRADLLVDGELNPGIKFMEYSMVLSNFIKELQRISN